MWYLVVCVFDYGHKRLWATYSKNTSKELLEKERKEIDKEYEQLGYASRQFTAILAEADYKNCLEMQLILW